MEQMTFPVYKSKPMKPLLYPSLITSTPNSHKIAKRIKGLQGYSEHYKGKRVDDPNVGPKFAPLRTRDYRKAQELTLEIWNPMIQDSFLEKFLRFQRNIHTIKIRILTPHKGKGVTWKRVYEILGKINRLTRIWIDFGNTREYYVNLDLSQGMESLRLLPRLKDLDVTVDGKQFLPFSKSLTKVGFEIKDKIQVKSAPILKKMIEKTPKFNQLDTIRISTNQDDEFLAGLVLVISKLPNFREMDFNCGKGGRNYLPSHFLDSLAAKAPDIEILKLGFPAGNDLISLLKHPIFKAKSLRRTSFSLGFAGSFAKPDYLNEVFSMLGEIASLYELSLVFYSFGGFDNGITESHIEKIKSIRKLKIVYDFESTSVSEKQAGDIFRSIFNKMHFLEELELHLIRRCLGLSSKDIQGLPRLKKATLNFMKSLREIGDEDSMTTIDEVNHLGTIMEILGKCHQLRELDLQMAGNGSDYPDIKFCESLSKLIKLQVFSMNAIAVNGDSRMAMETLENLGITCHKLRNLQDLEFMFASAFRSYNRQEIRRFHEQLVKNPKYRVVCM